MRASTRPEPIGKAFEVDLVNLIEDRHHSLLNNFVLQSRDAQRTLPPISLRNVDSPRGLCPIRSTVHPGCANRQVDPPIRFHTLATSRHLHLVPLLASKRKSCPGANRRSDGEAKR